MYRFIIINLFLAFTAVLQAQELVYTDAAGTIRWKKNKQEVSLFGANYCLPSACDFRAAAYMRGDRKQMIAEDMDHFKRMNWDAPVSYTHLDVYKRQALCCGRQRGYQKTQRLA